jgi:pSer/pThr/pTyr-binding forkhead associated (FHA) protein
LDELASVGLVETERERRGVLPATRYVASPAGMFAFKERVLALALPPGPPRAAPALTQPADPAPPSGRAGAGPGLLLVHGDVPGRWYALAAGGSWIVGRDPKAEIRLAYDPFVSARHAHIHRNGSAWRVTDLHSTNGMSVNFEPLAAGEERAIATGDVLTVGKSRLVFRSA